MSLGPKATSGLCGYPSRNCWVWALRLEICLLLQKRLLQYPISREEQEDGSEGSKSPRGQTGSFQLLPGLSYPKPHLRTSPLISPLWLFPSSPCTSLFLMSGCATNPLELEQNPTCCKEMTQIRGFWGAAEILFLLLHVLVVYFFNSSFAQAAPFAYPVLVG